jgi:flagellar protein FliS
MNPYTDSQAQGMANRYLIEAVQTATPAARLVMLWDKIMLDMKRADEGFANNDLKLISDSLINAQEILLALQGTLKTEFWEGAQRLASLYGFLHKELVEVNMSKDRPRLAQATDMITRLSDAWHKAAEGDNSEQTAPGTAISGESAPAFVSGLA